MTDNDARDPNKEPEKKGTTDTSTGGSPPKKLTEPRRNDPIERPPNPPSHVVIDGVTRMALENAAPIQVENDPAAAWNAVILSTTEAMRFRNYYDFIERVFCSDRRVTVEDSCSKSEQSVTQAFRNAAGAQNDLFRAFSNRYAYDLLKAATEAFVALECACYSRIDGRLDDFGAVLERENDVDEIRKVLLEDYLVGNQHILPYIDSVCQAFIDVNRARNVPVSLCEISELNRFKPCAIELIWSYWHEEGMLVQSINAISLRFQNKRIQNGRDPLAHFELTPLRPLNNLLWGYIQDEQNRLTVARRGDEYLHQYGFPLFGKALRPPNPADVRSKFIEAFHNLLHIASTFFHEQSNRFVVPDAFPLLNAIREVHLILAEGAHNQFGDLALTARVEMLIQKWLLSRPEMERFLAGRFMVPYPEPWMGVVDTMKTLQGWTDVSVRHFRDLAVWGEQLLLSLRWNNWSDHINLTTVSAENWATIYREAIQGYIHAYRAVTGVDLAASTTAIQLASDSYIQPSVLLRNRLAAQRRTL
jgi:hypothetical protein